MSAQGRAARGASKKCQDGISILCGACTLLASLLSSAQADTITPDGTRGLWRVQSADRLNPSTWGHALTASTFDQSTHILEGQRHRFVGGRYSLTFRPHGKSLFSPTEWALSWDLRSYQVEDRAEGLDDEVFAVGDFTLRSKVEFLHLKHLRMGASLDARFLTSEGAKAVAFTTTTPTLSLLTTLRWSTVAWHAQAGTTIDQSTHAFQSLDPYLGRTARAAQGIGNEDRLAGGTGVEYAPLHWLVPFVELTAEVDSSGRAYNSFGELVPLTFRQNPIRVTPGMKLIGKRAALILSCDLGFLSKSFPGEGSIVPDWTAGLSFQLVPSPRKRRYGGIKGRIIDSQTLTPLHGAGVTLVNRSDKQVGEIELEESRGRISPTKLPVGRYSVLAVRPLYEETEMEITIDPGRIESIRIALEPEGFVQVEPPEPESAIEPSSPPREAASLPGIEWQIPFWYNSVEMKWVGAEFLDLIADFMFEHPELTIEVRGHTDNSGDEPSNEILSWVRAEVVFHHLAVIGVDESRIQYKGYGSSLPIAPNDDREGRILNRRVDFLVLPADWRKPAQEVILE